MARKKLRYLLFDFPADHEVDSSISTESETVKALLMNRGLGTRAKLLRFSSKNSLGNIPNCRYDPKFVHVATHGTRKSIQLLGGSISWRYFAERVLKPRLKPLEETESRILFLSCCSSTSAKNSIAKYMKGYFTGIYHFRPKSVKFADSLTVAGNVLGDCKASGTRIRLVPCASRPLKH